MSIFSNLRFSLLTLLVLFFFNNSKGQVVSELCNKLIDCGFENIRMKECTDSLLISAENNTYRWEVAATKSIIDSLKPFTKEGNKTILFITKNDIPQLQVTIQKGKKNRIKYPEEGTWNKLKRNIPKNISSNKIDLVLYPELAIQNTLFTHIYEVKFNIAPAFEVDLWRGMTFTGQVVIPIYVDPIYWEDMIRPGVVTLSQRFRLPKNWYGRLTMGNFTKHRYGIDFTMEKPLSNRVSIIGNFGVTGRSGYSYWVREHWITEPLDKLTWHGTFDYFIPRFDLQCEVTYEKFLNSDKGLRFDCTRHFRETTVGFYAMLTEGETNGGFHFTVPIGLKRLKRRTIRPRVAKYFGWEYNAGTEFHYGQKYRSSPVRDQTSNWWQPDYFSKKSNN